jgi:hypothetical protein
MSMSNMHGWEFTLPHDVVVVWDGVSNAQSDHVKILSGEKLGNLTIATTITGNATITFHFNVNVETDKGHYCLLSGPPNYPFEGAQPLNAVWRSDFYNYSQINFCWRMTKANEEITFPKGMPVMFLMNYPIGLLEKTEIEFKNVEDAPTLKDRAEKYTKKRQSFYASSPAWSWGNFYKKGIGPDDEVLVDNPFKLSLKDPQ